MVGLLEIPSISLGKQESNQFSSVTQLCPTLCDPIDCGTPGFLVHHQLPELAQNKSTELVMPSNHLILCCPLLLLSSIFASIRVFSESALASGGQSIGVSISVSVLPMNIQDWFPLRLTGLISLQSTSVEFHSVTQSCPTLCDLDSQSLLKLLSVQSVMPRNNLILCHPLHFLPSIFPSIRVFSNEWVTSSHQVAKVLEFQLHHQSF